MADGTTKLLLPADERLSAWYVRIFDGVFDMVGQHDAMNFLDFWSVAKGCDNNELNIPRFGMFDDIGQFW